MTTESSKSASNGLPPGVVRLRFFSALRDATGTATLDLPVQDGWPISAVEDWVTSRYPVAQAYREVWRIAVNHRYVDRGAAVKPGDEIAFITPVSGG
jgi:molybdopterin converting factor subunit 1